ncbi:hypothetical protein X907_1435 [Glycocaulis alkaliphilus]|uniref:Uncharacterized protein n=1 Tax=Glycocaulis alkaliphilus TaxID=1434191 RepID=A0A3T0EA88_9PROT|nr:hypothetical protein X907_1435 [Glycocaulis alkaliphilus]
MAPLPAAFTASATTLAAAFAAAAALATAFTAASAPALTATAFLRIKGKINRIGGFC